MKRQSTSLNILSNTQAIILGILFFGQFLFNFSTLNAQEKLEERKFINKLFLNASQEKSDFNKKISIYRKALDVATLNQISELEYDALVFLGKTYTSASRTDSAIYYHTKALDFCDSDLKKTNTLLSLTHLHTISRNFDSSENYINELESLVKESVKKNELQVEKAILLKEKGKNDEAEDAFNIALNDYKQIDNQKFIAICYRYLASNFYAQAKYKNAIRHLEKARNIFNNLQAKKELAKTYDLLGLCYKDMGLYDRAMEAQLNALANRDTNLYITDLAINYRSIGNVLLKQNQIQEAIPFFEKSIHITKELSSKNESAKTLLRLAETYKSSNNYNKAIEFSEKAIQNFKLTNNSKELAYTYNQLGGIYLNSNTYDKALENYLEALRIRETLNKPTEIAQTLNNLGLVYYRINRQTKALEYFEQSLNIKRKHDTKASIAYTLLTMGNIQAHVGNYKSAIESYLEASNIREKLGDSRGVASIAKNLGDTYLKTEDIQQAKDYYKLSLKLRTRLEDDRGLADTYNSLGNLYLNTNNNSLAFQQFQKALKHAEKIDNKFIIGLCSRKLGLLHIEKKEKQKAFTYFNKSLEIGLQMGHLEMIKQAYHALYLYHFSEPNYKKALQFHKLFAETKDSILKQQTSEEILDAQLKYEIEKKQIELAQIENEIKDLQRERKLQDIELDKEKNFRSFLLILVALSAIAMFFGFRLFQNKRKTAAILSKNNQLLEDSNRKLSSSEAKLKGLNNTKDKLFSIIAHDLKGPMNAIMGFSDLIQKNQKDLDSEQLTEYTNYIHSGTKQLSNLLENLLQWAHTQTKQTKFQPEKFNLKEIVDENIELLHFAAKSKQIEFIPPLNSNFEIFGDRNMITTVLRNLISNAIKFNHVNGTIQIKCIEDGHFIQVSVLDSGTGIPEDTIPKLLDVNNHYSTKGTENESGTGLGLVLCQDFIRKNGGKLNIESQVNKGSTFSFTIKKSVNHAEEID